MAKRLFEILDEMNQNDEKNNTATCGCNFSFVSANKVKAGGHVTMGVPESVIIDLWNKEDVIPILLILDRKEYNRISNSYT